MLKKKRVRSKNKIISEIYSDIENFCFKSINRKQLPFDIKNDFSWKQSLSNNIWKYTKLEYKKELNNYTNKSEKHKFMVDNFPEHYQRGPFTEFYLKNKLRRENAVTTLFLSDGEIEKFINENKQKTFNFSIYGENNTNFYKEYKAFRNKYFIKNSKIANKKTDIKNTSKLNKNEKSHLSKMNKVIEIKHNFPSLSNNQLSLNMKKIHIKAEIEFFSKFEIKKIWHPDAENDSNGKIL